MKYIMPDWDDYLDDGFNFITDEFSGPEQRKYVHEIMGEQTPYDGLLVSLIQIQKKKGALKHHYSNSNNETVREIMRVPDRVQIIGDCGAFTYKDNPVPTIQPEEAAALYERYGFDVGASVDHMIVDYINENVNGKITVKALTEEEKDRRVALTIENARRFIECVRRENYQFEPMGSIQARTATEYADVFDQFIEMGYRTIALGSLIPKNDDQIQEIILAVGQRYQRLPDDIKEATSIHLFGILRPKLLHLYEDNGIKSFDSASYFRKAWLKSDKNYLDLAQNWYPAIRVPQSALPKNRKKLIEKGCNIEYVGNLETRVLAQLSAFNKETSIDELLELLIEYDGFFERNTNSDHLKEEYRRLLTDRPWEKCNCPICQQAGIHVVIFRGYNRNKRRGFHNTYAFYRKFKGDYPNDRN